MDHRNDQLKQQLNALESQIAPAVEDALRGQWISFWEGRFTGQVFAPKRQWGGCSIMKFPETHINDAQDNFTAMACDELDNARSNLADTGFFPCVRCNFGVGILPSLFGVPIQLMDRTYATLPSCRPIGRDAALRLLDKGLPDVRSGLGGKVLDMAAFFKEQFKPYPNVSQYVPIYHPDLQGPMDTCELIWGNDLFIAVYEEPDIVKAFLSLVCEMHTKFLNAFCEIIPFNTQYNYHWGCLHPGKIVLRDDSAMNFSPEMFSEFIAPYDQQLLNDWDGGAIHFCGRGDHYIDSMTSLTGMHAILMSQPHLNDMETIFRATVDKGIAVSMPAARASEWAGKRDLKHRVIAK